MISKLKEANVNTVQLVSTAVTEPVSDKQAVGFAATDGVARDGTTTRPQGFPILGCRNVNLAVGGRSLESVTDAVLVRLAK